MNKKYEKNNKNEIRYSTILKYQFRSKLNIKMDVKR